VDLHHNSSHSYVGSRDAEHHPRGDRICERQSGRKHFNGQSESQVSVQITHCNFQNSELRESVKQLSELQGIPFGDRNKLRQRAENIFCTWPSTS
jgi:hypothetical protein